jgi:hypothetical protein
MNSFYLLSFVDVIIIFIILFVVIIAWWYHTKPSPIYDRVLSSGNKNKVAVITSIYGDYDNLKEHNINQKSNVDWYCFTDNKKIQSNTWKLIHTPYHLQNKDAQDVQYVNGYSNVRETPKIYNMMCAKFYKIKTHTIDILQEYDYYIWIDGSIILRQTFLDKMLGHIEQKHELIQFKHSVRNNIKDETYVSVQMEKYKTQILTHQYAEYRNEGFPDKSGLFENTIIVRKKNDRCNAIFDKWWIHNLKHSYQDQISYPYVLWSLKEKPDYIIEENVFNNDEYSYTDGSLMTKH